MKIVSSKCQIFVSKKGKKNILFDSYILLTLIVKFLSDFMRT